MEQKALDKSGAEYVQKRMPMIGLGPSPSPFLNFFQLGTWEIRSAKTIQDVLDAALDVGYRLVDTAQVYRNEQHIGRALQELLPKYGLDRSRVFIFEQD
jgi:diketogulonate reductase-like aldo/keto reductase